MFVKKIIKDSYKNWKPNDTVLIRTQTGTGKTTFILKKLLPYAAEKNRIIIMLVNRTALLQQLEEKIYRKYYAFIDFIQVYTYQSYVKKAKHIEGYYYVLDEAHYFIADSSFNDDTMKCFMQLMANRDSIRILMTATEEYVLLTQIGGYRFDSPYTDTARSSQYSLSDLYNVKELIMGKELTTDFTLNYNNHMCSLADIREKIGEFYSLRKTFEHHDYLDEQIYSLEHWIQPYRRYFRERFKEIETRMEQVRERYICYENPNCYDYIQVKYCNKKEELLDIIRASENQKWLWFVRQTKNGEELMNQLSGMDIKSVMLTKDSKNKKKNIPERIAYEKIIKNNTFDEKVLFSTSVLDNGVNVEDILLKNIVIEADNETEFLQMLGRIRINPTWENHTVTLYLINQSVDGIIKQFDYTTMENMRFIAGFQYCKRSNPDNWTKLYTKYKKQIIHNGRISGGFEQLLTIDKFSVDEKHGREFIYRKFEINDFIKLKNTYDYYKLMAWLEEVFETEQQKEWLISSGQDDKAAEYTNEYPWIRYRLSWMGKQYDPKGWIHTTQHSSLHKELLDMLETYRDAWMPEEQEEYFRNLIRRYGASMQPVHKIVKTKCSRIQIVNDALKEWGFPYQIVKSHKSHNGKQRDWWNVVHV